MVWAGAGIAQGDNDDLVSLAKKCEVMGDNNACFHVVKKIGGCRNSDDCRAAITTLDSSHLNDILRLYGKKLKPSVKAAIIAERTERQEIAAARKLKEDTRLREAISKAFTNQYYAEVLYTDTVKSLLFFGKTASGDVMSTTVEGSGGFPAGFDPGLMKTVRDWLEQRHIVFVVTPDFFLVNKESWEGQYTSAAAELNRIMGGSSRGTVSINFRILDTPELRLADFREGLARALFGASLTQAQEMARGHKRGMYRQFRGREGELSGALQKDLPLWEKAQAAGTIDSCNEFIRTNPQSPYVEHARAVIDDHQLFDESSKHDWLHDYELYLASYPNGLHSKEAKERMAYLSQTRRAVMTVDTPWLVESRPSPWLNVPDPVFSWITIFKELSGKSGYKVTCKGYILDAKGEKWVNPDGSEISRGELTVSPGGTVTNDYWISGAKFCNGRAVFNWNGVDAGGHSLNRVEMVFLNCKK